MLRITRNSLVIKYPRISQNKDEKIDEKQIHLPLLSIPLLGSPPARGTIPTAMPRNAPQMYQQEAIWTINSALAYLLNDWVELLL